MLALVLAGVPVGSLNMANQLAVLHLLGGAGYLQAFGTDQLQALSLFFIELHEDGIFIAQLIWGLWLFPLGYLVLKSGFLPRVLGILLMIGCFGYLLHSFGMFLMPDNQVVEAISSLLLVVSFVAEMSFTFWLLIKGVSFSRQARREMSAARPSS